LKGVEDLDIREVTGGAILAVKAAASASRERVVGVLGDCLKVATAAPPAKGKANAALVAILAKALGVDKRDVELVRGQRSPRKEFRIASLSAGQVRCRLADLGRHGE
jgi:uncharacterized protein (TIGR00251 family)